MPTATETRSINVDLYLQPFLHGGADSLSWKAAKGTQTLKIHFAYKDDPLADKTAQSRYLLPLGSGVLHRILRFEKKLTDAYRAGYVVAMHDTTEYSPIMDRWGECGLIRIPGSAIEPTEGYWNLRYFPEQVIPTSATPTDLRLSSQDKTITMALPYQRWKRSRLKNGAHTINWKLATQVGYARVCRPDPAHGEDLGLGSVGLPITSWEMWMRVVEDCAKSVEGVYTKLVAEHMGRSFYWQAVLAQLLTVVGQAVAGSWMGEIFGMNTEDLDKEFDAKKLKAFFNEALALMKIAEQMLGNVGSWGKYYRARRKKMPEWNKIVADRAPSILASCSDADDRVAGLFASWVEGSEDAKKQRKEIAAYLSIEQAVGTLSRSMQRTTGHSLELRRAADRLLELLARQPYKYWYTGHAAGSMNPKNELVLNDPHLRRLHLECLAADPDALPVLQGLTVAAPPRKEFRFHDGEYKPVLVVPRAELEGFPAIHSVKSLRGLDEKQAQRVLQMCVARSDLSEEHAKQVDAAERRALRILLACTDRAVVPEDVAGPLEEKLSPFLREVFGPNEVKVKGKDVPKTARGPVLDAEFWAVKAPGLAFKLNGGDLCDMLRVLTCQTKGHKTLVEAAEGLMAAASHAGKITPLAEELETVSKRLEKALKRKDFAAIERHFKELSEKVDGAVEAVEDGSRVQGLVTNAKLIVAVLGLGFAVEKYRGTLEKGKLDADAFAATVGLIKGVLDLGDGIPPGVFSSAVMDVAGQVGGSLDVAVAAVTLYAKWSECYGGDAAVLAIDLFWAMLGLYLAVAGASGGVGLLMALAGMTYEVIKAARPWRSNAEKHAEKVLESIEGIKASTTVKIPITVGDRTVDAPVRVGNLLLARENAETWAQIKDLIAQLDTLDVPDKLFKA